MPESVWLPTAKRDTPASIRLFCLPYAGAGASVFRPWQMEMPSTVQVCPVQLPGREDRFRETPYRSLTALAEAVRTALTAYLDRPVCLFGHSMGAYIAYELARQLTQAGRPPAHVFVSGRQAPHLPLAQSPIHGTPDAEFMQLVRERYNGIPEEVWREQELIALVLPALRADFTLVETYRPPPPSILTCPVTAFGGAEDPHTSIETLGAWQSLTTGAFRLRMFPGGHFFLKHARNELLTAIAAEMALGLRV